MLPELADDPSRDPKRQQPPAAPAAPVGGETLICSTDELQRSGKNIRGLGSMAYPQAERGSEICWSLRRQPALNQRKSHNSDISRG